MQAYGPVILIVGTRPEAIKMMPVYFALKEAGTPVFLCSTMQHDQLLYDVLDLFGIIPNVDLGIMRIGQDLFYVTQSLLQKTKELYKKINPSLVLVQGDTTSTMAAALAAFYLKIPVGHVEAGLRTHDIYAPFPEEMNRRVVTSLATFHFTPTAHTTGNLVAEGIDKDTITCTGNTVVDALRIVKERIVDGKIAVSLPLKQQIAACKKRGKLILLTMHRRESFNGGIKRVLQTVAAFLKEHQEVFCFYPFHPNPQVINAVQEVGLSDLANCFLSEPIAYQDVVYLLDQVDLVLTDSGGIQEEAISLGKQVLVLREKTERREGIWAGLATLVGTDGQKLHNKLYSLLAQQAAVKPSVVKPSVVKPSSIYGDGYAANHIVRIIKQKFEQQHQVLRSVKIVPVQKYNEDTMKKVTVLGLGYIGLPTSIVLAESGWDVVGFDIDAERVDAINKGEPVIQEPDLFEKLQIALQTEKFKASTTISQSDYFIIAVPTPFKEGKRADLSFVFTAAQSIASVLKKGDVIILESTVPVGATQQLATYLCGQSGLHMNDFYLAHCPERVLPGRIFKELVANDRVIGGIDKDSVYKAQELYAQFVTGTIYLTDANTAEMVKLIENSSRDVEIAFAHQVASMAYAVGLNPYEVIELANKHPRVNILKPSSGVGGHCIAVDPWFLIETFERQTQLLQSARHINDARPFEVLEYIYKATRQWCKEQQRSCNVLLMGLTYKPDVDDLRESPAVRIANMVREHNAINMLVCEPHLNQKKLKNLYADAATTVTEGLQQADVVVFLVAHTRFRAIDKKLLHNKKVLDFCGVLQGVMHHKKENLYWPASSLSFFMHDMPEQHSAEQQKQESL